MDCYKLGNEALYKKTKWIAHMNGLPWGGQMKKQKKGPSFCKEKAKVKPPINITRYKRLSLGDVQTCDGILETMCKPYKATSRILIY